MRRFGLTPPSKRFDKAHVGADELNCRLKTSHTILVLDDLFWRTAFARLLPQVCEDRGGQVEGEGVRGRRGRQGDGKGARDRESICQTARMPGSARMKRLRGKRDN